MTTPNTLPVNGGVSDAEIEAGASALVDSCIAKGHWARASDESKEGYRAYARSVLMAAAQSRQPSAQGGEAHARAILKKHAALYGDSRYEPAQWVVDAMIEVAPPPAGGGKEALSEHQIAVRLHDFPALSAFHQKHAMGPLAAPSCLCCGKSTQGTEIGVQHMELPGVVICKSCKDRASNAPQDGLAGDAERLTPDEVEVLLQLLGEHDGSDFEPECPSSTAYRKLAAIRAGQKG